MENSRVYSFRGNEKQGGKLPDLKQKRKKSADSEEAIRCKTCGRTVTTKRQKIVVGSSHSHTFFNPAGIVFELACFRRAPGCHVVGESTSEFTWFAGHVWRFALCSGCNSHLGWYFEAPEQSFFGLILANLQQ
jgi:hypothetical protein